MAFTYPLAIPASVGFSSFGWELNDITAKNQSPYTAEAQIAVFQGQWFSAQIAFGRMTRTMAAPAEAFVAALRGRAGTFLMARPDATGPLGVAATTPGTPLVNGSGQSGNSLAIDGCPTSRTGWLLAGSYIQLGSAATSRLYKVLEDVNTNGSGQATLTLWPNLRTSPADNAALTLTSPKTVFRRTEDKISWAVDVNGHRSISFPVEEAL